jgi:hypothetical protein
MALLTGIQPAKWALAATKDFIRSRRDIEKDPALAAKASTALRLKARDWVSARKASLKGAFVNYWFGVCRQPADAVISSVEDDVPFDDNSIMSCLNSGHIRLGEPGQEGAASASGRAIETHAQAPDLFDSRDIPVRPLSARSLALIPSCLLLALFIPPSFSLAAFALPLALTLG